ncbi:uncharacterized protein [Onthophagus taurus]|uniref:uncharacterized protein n=1 Tax=Onthophagus taurus TaxID=166361 RepID=UPI0039BE56C4
MRRRGITGGTINRVREIYAETIARVKVGDELTDRFWTTRGLRQGCPLSSALFALYTADMEDRLTGGQMGGVVVGRRKVHSLAYADDLVVVAREAKEMKAMMRSLESYFRGKALEVNVGKTKVMKFCKGGRRKSEDWRWEGKEIEEVREYTYLGYRFREDNKEGAHVRAMAKKANKVMGQVWGWGERLFGRDMLKRKMIFECLIKSVMMYGAEIWGWKEQGLLEGVQARYWRWVLGLAKETPEYIVREEVKVDKLRVEAGKRAVRFEERVEGRSQCKILGECWKEIKAGKGGYGQRGREEYFRRVGYSVKAIDDRRREGIEMWKELESRDRDVQRQERRGQIRESRYNPKYEEIITEGLPKYLSVEGDEEGKRMVARFRCGNEERANRYWMRDDERGCRLCGGEWESLEHLLRECDELREEVIGWKQVLGEGAEGREWMREVVATRQRREMRGGDGEG